MVTNDSCTIRRVSDTNGRKTSSPQSRKVSIDNVTALPIAMVYPYFDGLSAAILG